MMRPRRDTSVRALLALGSLTLCLILAGLGAPAVSLASGDEAARIIRPGDGQVLGARIQAYDNLWRIEVRYRDGRVVNRGVSSDHVSFHAAAGHRYLTRIEATTLVSDTEASTPRGGVSMTYNVFNPETMLPAYTESRELNGSWRRQIFEADHVSVQSRDENGAQTQRQISLSRAVYDFDGGMSGLILAALPLRSGFVAMIPSLGDADVVLRRVSVMRRERIAAGRLGAVDAWVVQVGEPEEGVRYWIASRAPYVIRCEIARSDGSLAIWSMV